MSLLHLCLSALCLGPAAGQVELPESLAARAWASVGPETVPVDLERELFAQEPWLAAPGEASPERVWSRWGAWLAAEGRSEAIDARRRAGLTILAVHQGRWEDAWAHFERLGAAPEWAAALVPLFVPGVPIEHLAAASDPNRGLPEGLLLRPAVPPRPADDPPTSLRPREAWVRGLRLGEAVLDLRVSIEPSGIEVDLWHLSGEASEVRVLLPEPPGQEIRVEYIDWMRLESLRQPLVLLVSPGDEEHNLFGRFRPRPSPLPALPRAGLPRGLELGGLWFAVPEDPPLVAEARHVASALGALFGFESGVLASGVAAPPGPWHGTLVRLEAGSAGLEKLVAVLSLAERHVLGGGLQR